MQRRAVAVYVALFLLIGMASYALIATADSPEVTFDDPDFTLQEGEEFTIDGQTYTVTSIDREEEEDLGEVTVTHTGEVEWQEVQQQQAEWADGDVIELDDAEWLVEIDNGTVLLTEQQDREAILSEDSNADNETVESDGEEYVVVRDEEGNATFVPADEYFGEPQERQYSEGDSLQYGDHTATVEEVTEESAHLSWEAEVTETRGLDHERNVTLQGTDYIVFFPGDDTVVLDSDHDAYQAQLASIDTFDQRISGFWRIITVTGLAVLLLVSMTFLPSRY